MGGDFAPTETVAGAVMAREELGIEVVLVGDETVIKRELASQKASGFEIIDAPEVIAMGEEGAWAAKAHPRSSLMMGAEYVREGNGQALVSAGNTGAAMAASFLSWGRIRRIKRPAIAVVLPPLDTPKILIDAGANAESRPEHLKQFALMGAAYYRIITGKKDVRVGLLNIGSEEGKGNELTRESYPLLRSERKINFVGNVEGRDITNPDVDVIVTDGFTGNIVLKTIEGTASFITGLILRALGEMDKEKLVPVLPALVKVKDQLDYEEAGGALLLGVRGVCVIAHGGSKARAIKSAIRVAAEAVRGDLPGKIEKLLVKG
jgi:glycerol-3-phosphate acyltransferase PlsX